MMNTKKLLYILPDAAYIAEVLPTKKAHTFSIHAFRQINGSFIDENEFIAENVRKLIHKIDAEEYHLILPDFLFTNTIIDIKETKESAVKEYLKEKLLPSLDLSKETHEIDSFILTQHAGKSKVQLSALEKSLMDPVREAAHDRKVIISHISPLSWTIKSVISLEPSLSTIQIGEMLYMALHYIGIDQTISFNISETANVIETVKTLKGAEPNIQTMYLLTNGVVEQQIKEQLSGTLPIQQLTNLTDETEGIPSFIKQIILAGARTLDIPEQPIPRFSLGKESTSAASAVSKTSEMPVKTPPPMIDEEEPKATKTLQVIPDIEPEETALPVPSMPVPTAPPVLAEVPDLSEITNMSEQLASSTPKLTQATRPVPLALTLDDEPEDEATEVASEVAPATTVESLEPEEEDDGFVEPFSEPEFAKTKPAVEEEAEVVTPKTPTAPRAELVPTAPVVLPSSYKPTQEEEIDENEEGEEEETEEEEEVEEEETAVPVKTTPQSTRKVIKNNNDAGALFKIILITLGALVTTVAVGVGIGFGLLKMSENGGMDTPVVETTPTPVPSLAPSPSASPSAAPVSIDKTKFKILVVNATTVAGQAGKIKASLTSAGYKSVATGNAKGSYPKEGNYLLVSDSNKGTLSTLSKDSGLTLGLGTTKATEDPNDTYDAVIVIAE